MSIENNVQTNVQQVDVDLDSLFDGAPGADSVITPSEPTEIKPNIFSKKKTSLDFLDGDSTESKKTSDTFNSTTNNVDAKDEVKADLEEILDEGVAPEFDENNKSDRGRPRTDKSGLVGFLKKRIESNEMFAFDDYDETKQSLDDYLAGLSEKDVDDLWQANINNLKQEVAAKTPTEFFDSLPEELQYAAKYVADGGQDLKGLFQALAAVEQVRELDPTDEYDQEMIVRNYLQATNFGTPDEIEEELDTWKDVGVLEKKARQFKPKLDAMQEEVVRYQVEQQELRKQQQEEAAETYQQNVFEALRPGEINGLRLDKKTQAQLYSGLVQPQYPSISGRPTNLLGHLLERYQYVEPNYPLIAEALWLLSNPDEYRQSLMKQGKNQAVEQTVRQLKTEQARKNISTYHEEDEDRRPRKIAKPQNIFKR
ncbi:MAG: hypothetical protein ACK52I_34725 [Pseudomonadota bacterium]